MSLFEIDLNANFKFTNKTPYLSQNDFYKYFKENNLNTTFQTDEFSALILEDNIFSVSPDSIMNQRLTYYRNEHNSVKQIISMNLFEAYDQHFNSSTPTELTTKLFGCEQDYNMYPNWQLFYIGLNGFMFSEHIKRDFTGQLSNFQKLSEIIYKEYLIRNIRFDLSFENNEEALSFQDNLYSLFSLYKKSIFTEPNELIEFLKYLLKLHYHFLENEKYKLMWNLESSYIIACINILLREFELSYTEIVEQINEHRFGNQQTDLNNVYIDIVSYVRDKSPYYAGTSFVTLINTTFNNTIDSNNIVDILNSNDRYLEILSSIIELNQRFYGNKRNESTVVSITRGIVLDIEEIIRGHVENNENLGLFNCLKKIKQGSHLLTPLRDQIGENDSGEEFFNKLRYLIDSEDETIEKYLMIYYHSRNYISHNIIDFHKFFYEEDQVVVKNVLNAVIIILFYLETL